MNVALTRAKNLIIVVGKSKTLCLDKHWNKLIEFYKAKSRLIEVLSIND